MGEFPTPGQDVFVQQVKDNTRTIRGLAEETREEIAYVARLDENMATYENCVPDDEKTSSPEAGQLLFRACDDDTHRDALCFVVTRSQSLECRVFRRDTLCCVTTRSQNLEGNHLEGTVTPALFSPFSNKQRRASGGLGANQNVGPREPKQKLISPKKKKKMSVEFQEIRDKTMMVENCKNIIEGINEDHDETLCEHHTSHVHDPLTPST